MLILNKRKIARRKKAKFSKALIKIKIENKKNL